MKNHSRPSVLFVCLGNICRSPTAEAVFRHKARLAGLDVFSDSAGTLGFHQGSPPDPRTVDVSCARGYDFSGIVSRPVVPSDFQKFDYIFAMDRQNLSDLKAGCPSQFEAKIALLLDYSDSDYAEVPDPYYGSNDGFQLVVNLIEGAVDKLIAKLLINR